MSKVRAYPFADGLVVDRGEAAPLALLDAAGRAIWQGLDAGLQPGEITAALAGDADRVAAIVSARVPAAAAQPAPAPRIRRALRTVVRTYGLGGRPVAIDCADQELADLVHPRLAHVAMRDRAVATLRLRYARDGYALVETGRPAVAFARVEALVGATMRRMVEIGTGSTAWSAVLHAAAVSDGAGGAIVLPGACGRGKSTLTAALVGSGAAYLSDDCVPLGLDGRAVAVPFGICLKRSGWAAGEAVLPESAAAPVFVCAERGPCRYVPPRRVATGRLPLAAFVFPSFEAGAATAIAAMSPAETLTALVAGRAWLSREPAGLATALSLIERTPAWRLSYGSTAAALAAIAELVAARRAAE